METAGYVVRPCGLERCPLLAAQESQRSGSQRSGSGAPFREASQTFQSLLTGKKYLEDTMQLHTSGISSESFAKLGFTV